MADTESSAVKDLELTEAPLPALVAKPSAQEPLPVQSGIRIVIVWCQKFLHVRLEALSGMVGFNTTFPNSSIRTLVCEPAPHPSCALHSHSLFVPSALDHSTGVRNTANKETDT